MSDKKSNFIPNRSDWIFGSRVNDISKNDLIEYHISNMLIRSVSMFKWENLPETIDSDDLELILLVNGYVCIKDINNKLYALRGSLSGTKDVNYHYKNIIVNNPYINYNEVLDVNKNCVVIKNDPLFMGLIPMFARNSNQCAETDISLMLATINARIQKMIIANSDNEKEEALKYLEDLINGKLGVLGGDEFFDQIKTADFSNSTGGTNIKDLIELSQYQKAQWYLDIGLQSNYNMKREAINGNESGMNEDILAPLVDKMLECRRKGVQKINEMYGTNIKVDLSSTWKKQSRNDETPQKEKEEGSNDDENET